MHTLPGTHVRGEKMGWWRAVAAVMGLIILVLLQGCELGWDFLKEGGGGDAGAQTSCQNSQVVTGRFPASGALQAGGFFSATYSSPRFSGSTSSTALGLRISRHRLWLNDLAIEVSFFPFDDTERDPRNGCLGRAVLEVNIPEERLFFDDSPIDIQSTRISQTEVSAYYAEGGDPVFTASAVTGTLRLRSTDGSRVQAVFDLTFNPGASQRRLTNGDLEDDVDQNPAAEGF
jgi:hypothetical protein